MNRAQTSLIGLALGATLVGGCRVSPLTNQLEVGEEAYVVVVGEGADGQTDLYAGSASGGVWHRLTWTRNREWAPALDPSGVQLAFFRDDQRGATRLVVMNLLNAAEREADLPADGAPFVRVAWSDDGSRLYLAGSTGRWTTPAPPAALAPTRAEAGSPAEAEADSALAVLLGRPAFAAAGPCAGAPAALCIGSGGTVTVLDSTGADPFRWTADSVAWRVGDRVIIRPLGPGRIRTVVWAPPLAGFRQPTHFAPTPVR